MQKIVTATGKEFDILWCGASTIDFALRFAVVNCDMATIFQVFSNTAETKELYHRFDGYEVCFKGYTNFKGVDLKIDGEIVVALNPA